MLVASCVVLGLALQVAPQTIEIPVGGVVRTALVVAPTKASPAAPVVICFHGHGGNMRNALRSYPISQSWPEAVAVYPQGLPTATGRDPQGARAGWELRPRNNKDVAFFDALLQRLSRLTKVDPRRIFVAGHSNGGAFSYLLWGARPEVVRAVGPSAAAGARYAKVPKPAFIVMGETDTIVDPKLQAASIDAVKKLNGAVEPGVKEPPFITRYSGTAPTVTYVYPGGHNFQRDSVAPMVQFFQSLN